MNNKKSVIIGAISGLIFSVILCFTQDFDTMLYFSGAPLYIDSVILGSEGLINVITFIYFIVLFSIIGYVISSKVAKNFKMLIIVVLAVLHFTFAHFGAKTIFEGLPEALGNAVSVDVN